MPNKADEIITRRLAELEDAQSAASAAQRTLLECLGRLNAAVANLTAAMAVAQTMKEHKP